MNKTFLVVLILLVVAGGAYFWMGQNSKVEAPLVSDQSKQNDSLPVEMNPEVLPDVTTNGTTGEVGSAMSESGTNTEKVVAEESSSSAPTVREFTVEGKNFSFIPSTMKVKKGDRVRVIFKNTEGFHDFVLDEFKVATKQLKAPGEEVVEFTASKSGTFEYYCSVGAHRQMGMKGVLTVE